MPHDELTSHAVPQDTSRLLALGATRARRAAQDHDRLARNVSDPVARRRHARLAIASYEQASRLFRDADRLLDADRCAAAAATTRGQLYTMNKNT